MEKINSLTSADIVADNIQLLKQLFPTIVKEDKIDLNELKALLGENVEEKEEYYRFIWAGKNQARLEANKPTTATLRPNKKDSKNWETTGNVFIEGDNLEVLKLLQKSYANKIKMIYIDPPYNTGKDFVYKDNYADNLGNYLEITGQVDESGKKTSTNTESDGRYHSNWLNMMYPRLRLARNLMTDDGVIFISIDDNELHNLRKACDEIFGEDNFVAKFDWRKKTGANDAKDIAVITETILLYSKKYSNTVDNSIWSRDESSRDENRFNKTDEYFERRGRYYLDTLDRGGLGYIVSLDFGIIAPNGKEIFPNNRNTMFNDGWRWKWGKSKVEWGLKNGFFEFIEDKNKISGYSVKLKNYQFVDNDDNIRTQIGRAYLNLITEPINQQGNSEIQYLFDGKTVFSNPKPIGLLKYFLKIINDKSFTILDFFAGSGTTAHAVMQLNAEDGGNRKCISVQLPEPTDEKSEAFKAGYTTIAEITKERIRRAGEKIKQDFKDKEGIDKLDVGFKAFKLDSSNIVAWDGNPDNLAEQLDAFANNIKTDRSEEDILFEILLKYGLDLTVAIEEKTIAQQKVYSVGLGTLFICLSNTITPEVSEGIGAWKQELNPTRCRVIFKDTGFASDKDKVNAMQILKRFGVEEVNSI
jgi:adenine-specific DNA-methyltransferase